MKKDDWFTEDGDIREDLDVHDKDIPCFIRIGFVYKFDSPCSGCMYYGACGEWATDEKMDILREQYPKMFNGEIKTRGEYLKYVRRGGGT